MFGIMYVITMMTNQTIVIFSMQTVQVHAAAELPMSTVSTGKILIRFTMYYTMQRIRSEL